MRDEVPLLRRAFASLGDGSYNPTLTFVIVAKRHHTRLFPTRDQDMDRSGNVVAGTVIDTVMCGAPQVVLRLLRP